MPALLCLLFSFFGFALGGVMFSQLVPKRLRGIDVCGQSPDHNPGTVNVMRLAGRRVGLLCLFCDLMKGALPVALAGIFVRPDHPLFALVMIAPVLGHCLSPWSREIPGGKGIATAFGVLLAMLRYTFFGFALVFLIVFLAFVLKLRPHERCSALAFAIFAAASVLFAIIYHFPTFALGCVGFSAIVVYKNLKGIVRDPESAKN